MNEKSVQRLDKGIKWSTALYTTLFVIHHGGVYFSTLVMRL